MSGNPTQSLWRAVVAQAVADLLATPKGGSHDTELVRLAALHWLTATTGEDADARAHVCSLAGTDGDALRQSVLAVLAGRAFDPRQSGNADALLRLDEARALWLSHRDRPRVRRIAYTASSQPEVIGMDGPFSVNTLGALFYRGNDLPAARWRGSFIPSTKMGPGKVLYALTRPRGANLRSLRSAHMKDWQGIADALCAKFALDLVWLRDGAPSTDADPDARAFLIPRPFETSQAA